ncbi:MAG: hydroxymethylbilane synthase, partial [Bdellovibrionaceae bacterium]|nr:hydroxymethylbilane synthase [Pseudobdellovibrionaceae bacterium]
MRLVIASRKSDLARIQSYTVGAALKKNFPKLEIVYEFRESLGDKNLTDPLWKMPEKGVFTEDFYQGLVSGKWDMVVHSWKDLPVETRPDTVIAATMKRADVRDILLFKKSSFLKKKKEFTIFTSSPRRIYNLGNCLKSLLPLSADLKFESVRGNVQTRVRKLLEGDTDGLILAKAGLDRLLSAEQDEFLDTKSFLKQSLKELHWMVLPLSLNPTAAAQGALAIEIATSRKDLQEVLQSIHCEQTFSAVQSERETLKGWGGGCHQKIGINKLPREYGTVFMAKGQRDTGELIDIAKIEATEDVLNPGSDNFKSSIVAGSFQESPQAATWFEREELEPNDVYKTCNAHWVARALALPKTVSFDPEATLLWVSGVETWKKLAARGLWVHGTSDSMGEQENPQVELIDSVPRQWCKWTHSQGESFALGLVVNTYKLVPKATAPVYDSNCEHFFWMSGSSFEAAIKVYPWLLLKTHWSGPGKTHKSLKNHHENQRAKGHA